jgi:hypothetical protein
MRLVTCTIAGAIVGFAMVEAMVVRPLRAWIDTWPIAPLYDTIHYPAQWLFERWTGGDLASQAEAGFRQIAVAMLLQWIATGLIVGAVVELVAFLRRRGV